ncbi:hypothetical protein EON65_43090, partial [archaeon]
MMEEEDEEKTSTKRVAKKKHYPFGTPSHLHHPYSQYAHISVTDRSFALELATATDIKPEVIEEKPKKKRSVPIKKKPKETDEDQTIGSDGQSAQNYDEPCTKIACQIVVRTLADLEFKNQVERMDLEDEYERYLDDLRIAEQDVRSTEVRLDKITEIGNSLEISVTQLLGKVEGLEKTKENLQAERNDINTKLMLLEVERQKCNRKFEKAQKELTNAKWRKKKAMQAEEAEAGVTFQVSEIAEAPIGEMIRLPQFAIIHISPGHSRHPLCDICALIPSYCIILIFFCPHCLQCTATRLQSTRSTPPPTPACPTSPTPWK